MATAQKNAPKTAANFSGLAPTIGAMGADDTRAFTWSQELIATIKQHAGEYTRLAHQLWDMNNDTRKRILVHLGNFIKEAKANAGAGTAIKGMDAKKWKQVANSATVRASQMNAIVRAMNGNDAQGMYTRAKLALQAGIKLGEVDNVSMETMYRLCRDFNGQRAAAGRTPDDAPTKLAKTIRRELTSEKATEKDVRFWNKVKKVLSAAGIELPNVEKAEQEAESEGGKKGAKVRNAQQQPQAVVGAPAKAKTPRKVSGKAPAEVIERREDNKPLPTGITEDRRVH